MNMLLVALSSIACSVAAQFFLKAGMSAGTVKLALADGISLRSLLVVFTNPAIVAGFMLYGIGALIWLKVLSQWDVSKAYPLVGLGFVLTLAVGFFGGENITAARMAGVALICAGVWLVSAT